MKTYKIVVLGDFGVGKTSLIRRYVLDEFSDEYRATLGVHLYKHVDTLTDGNIDISLVVWDIEGAPLPSGQTQRYIAGASGAVIVGDMTRDDPYSAMWAGADMFEETLPGRPLCLALNKCDIAEIVSEETVNRMKRRYDCNAFRTSALTGDCVTPMFHDLARSILARGL
jgi:small GTP-binding protein